MTELANRMDSVRLDSRLSAPLVPNARVRSAGQRGGLKMSLGHRMIALIASTGLCTGLCTGLAFAGTQEPTVPERSSIETMAAHIVARGAMIDLQLIGSPTPRDYAIAAEIMRSAAELTPDDPFLLRLWLEAANGADDGQRVNELSRRLMKLDPQDTVSQLRVISSNINALQTSDDRLAAYQRFLGEDGDLLDRSVRSRLALDAALLLRERGDLQSFAEKLAQAIELDGTNKDATTLALAFHQQRRSDPKETLDLMLSVLYSDPFDPSVYSAIVRTLLNSGAYAGAERLARLHVQLLNSQGARPTSAEAEAFDIATWNSSGAEELIRLLSTPIDQQRTEAELIRRELVQAGKSPDSAPRSDDIRLPFARERSRLLASASLGDREQAQVFLMELSETARREGAALVDAARRPPDMTDDQAKQQIQLILAEMVWLRLWTGLQTEEAAKGVQILRDQRMTDDATLARLEAWLQLRQGDVAAADAALTGLSSADPLATMGLGVLAELRGDRGAAVQRYGDVVLRLPDDLAGAFARGRILSLRGQVPPLNPSAREMESTALALPGWLEDLVNKPKQTQSLTIQPLRSDIDPAQRTPVRVTLRNNAPIPLAVGPDKSMSSRLLFAPVVDVGNIRVSAADLVEVVSIDRRLRLGVNEEFSTVVWPDMGSLSHGLELIATRPTRVRWRVLQGFVLSEQRLYEAGPQSIAAEVAPLMRRVPPRADAVFEALRWSIQVAGTRELTETLLALRLQLASGLKVEPSELDRLMELLTRRFETMQKPTKLMVLGLLPPQVNLPQTVRIDQRVASETDEDILAVLIGMRINRKDDPVFSASAVVNSPRLTRLSQMVQQRIDEKVPVMAVAGLPLPKGTEAVRGAAEAARPPVSDPLAGDKPEKPVPQVQTNVPTVAPELRPMPILP